MNRSRRVSSAMLLAVALSALGTAAVSAHPHVVGDGTEHRHVIANGQNHPGFVFDANTGKWLSCVTHTLLAGYGPAWYGLETAHHGPDSLTPGRGDGCYAADASPLSEVDDVNPAID